MQHHPRRGSTPTPQRVRDVLKPISGAAVGNMLEWFDYSLYGYLSATLAKVFFPSSDPIVSLIAAFAAFSVAFVTRPLGALFFGSLGDRLGRRDTLAIVVGLISVSTGLVGVLPGYEAIGIAAPLLLVALRMIQGFSAGGEAGGALAFLAEYAPTRRRGVVIGFYNMSAGIGALSGSGLVLAITSIFGQTAVEAWAWRLPFLIAGPIGLGAFWLRLRIEETPAFRLHLEREGAAQAPLREALRDDWRSIVKCLGVAISHGIPYYLILAYLPSYLVSTGRLSSGQALAASGLAFLGSVIVIPFAAALSDRVGRRPVAFTAALAYLVVALPLFRIVVGSTPEVVIATMASVGVLMGMYGSAPFCMMTELFPTRTRYSAMSVGYNVAMVLFGGTAPLISASLTKLTGNPSSPAYFMMGGAVLSIFAILASPETSRVPIDELGQSDEHIRRVRMALKASARVE